MKKSIAFLSVVAASLAFLPASFAQSQLEAGDLLFVQLSSDAPDTFSFTFTKDIAAGTAVTFTDNGWDSTDTWRQAGAELRLSENSFIWTAPFAISAGAVITVNSHNLGLANSGDNLFAFQGSWAAPRFISGATWDQTTTWLSSGAATANNSYLPAALANGATAFARGANGDNTGYTGATTNGTTAALRSAIYGTPANWTTNDSTLVAPPASFTFTDATAAAAQTKTVATYNFGEAAGSYTTSATKVNGTNGSQVSFGGFQSVQVAGGGLLALDADGKDGYNNQGYATETTSTAFRTSSTLDLGADAAFEFTMTVNEGYAFDLDNVSFLALTPNGNGPQAAALYFSLDGTNWLQLGSDVVVGTAWATFSFTDSGDLFSGWTGEVDFRIYAWNAASATAQSLRLDEIYLEGAVSAVPEPGTCAMLVLGAGMTCWMSRRQRRQA